MLLNQIQCGSLNISLRISIQLHKWQNRFWFILRNTVTWDSVSPLSRRKDCKHVVAELPLSPSHHPREPFVTVTTALLWAWREIGVSVPQGVFSCDRWTQNVLVRHERGEMDENQPDLLSVYRETQKLHTVSEQAGLRYGCCHETAQLLPQS